MDYLKINKMKNKLTTWAMSQPSSDEFDPRNWGKAVESNIILPKLFSGPTSNKILGVKLNHFNNNGLDLNNTIILGGMCLLSRNDMKKIYRKEITFESLQNFETWFRSWYPRIDQIHDTVGVPPKSCKRIIYVVEDSFFSERLANQTGFDRLSIEKILRETHQFQGDKILKKWLSSFGYRDSLDVVYTSQIDRELNISLKIWERLLGFQFRSCDNEFAKVEMMYTGFWLDILGINTSAIIYEPGSKFVSKGWIHTKDWLNQNQYGYGVNKNLGIAGYIPFISSGKELGSVSYEEVPNILNYKNYIIPEEDLLWYVVNFLFPKKIICDNGPSIFDKGLIQATISNDLAQIYSI